MKPHHPRTWTQAEIAQQALEMLAIGNVATQKAQQRNSEQGIANYYSIAGRMVSDADWVKFTYIGLICWITAS